MENLKKKVELIAELAQGYEGNVKIAKNLIKASAKANADAVKFQLVFADEICTQDYKDYRIFKKLELKLDAWKNLKLYAKKNKLNFYVDIFGPKSLEFAKKINADGIKLHPTDIDNYDLFKRINKLKFKKVFVGIGGASYQEIIKIFNVLKIKSKIILLLGFQSYPTPFYSNQILRLTFLKEKFKFKNLDLGFADHSLPETPFNNTAIIASIGAGANYIEKHLTIPYHRNLEDYESAYKMKEFKNLKNEINYASLALGYYNNLKKNKIYISDSEKKYKKNVQRNLVSKKFLKKGTKINKKDFMFIRSASNNPVIDFKNIFNKKLKKDLEKNSTLTKNYI